VNTGTIRHTSCYYTGQYTKFIRNQNSWFRFISMCWIQIWP